MLYNPSSEALFKVIRFERKLMTDIVSLLLLVCILCHQKHNYANYAQFAPNFRVDYKTIQGVSVSNFKLFEPTKREVWTKEAEELSTQFCRNEKKDAALRGGPSHQ